MKDDPNYYYEDSDLEGQPRRKAKRDEWRRGNSPAQKQAILNAKATLLYIKEHPGCRRNEMLADGVKPNFGPLLEHGMVYWKKAGKTGRTMTNSYEARWFLK